MNIPKKQGVYTLNIGQKTIKIDIHLDSVRLTKMDLLGNRRAMGGYKNETKYDVKVFDSNNNIINQISTFDDSEYVGFISKLIADENGIPSNPNKIMDKIYMKIQKDLGLWVQKADFNGMVKGKMKMTFYIDDWDRNMECCYEPQKLVDYFESIGISCKVSPKKKQYRAGFVWVTTVYVPFDYNITENIMNKKVIKLTESNLHKIIKESVSRILNEANHIEIVEGSFGTITYLALFDYTDFQGRFPYVVKYSNKAYHNPIKDSYQLERPIKSEGFKTYKECLNFCQENGIKIVDEFNIKHSLSKGIPDTRSIKPWSHPKDFS